MGGLITGMFPTGPAWQWITPGDRVRPKRRRKQGEVVSVEAFVGGVTSKVWVVWDNDPACSELWDIDCLEDVVLPGVRFTRHGRSPFW